MAITVPHTWTAGDDATSTALQTLTQAILELQSPPRARLRQSVAQTLTTATMTGITMDVEDLDSDNAHSTSTNTSRFTCVTAGLYLVSGQVAFTGNATGLRYCELAVNGTSLTGTQGGFNLAPNGNLFTVNVKPTLVQLAVGDYVELRAQQSSGGNLATIVSGPFTSSMDVVRVSA